MSLFDTPTESVGLYGNTVTYGGTYFEWFIFQEAASAPATPTGGSWNFLTNVGTAPSGWSTIPPANPTNTVWASIAIVNSRDSSPLVWSTPASWTKPGTPGTSATVAVGTTTTSAPGGSASVTNSGTSTAAVFNFTIPRGDTGPAGTSGTSATVTAGTTTTGAAGTSASVVNSGTTSNAIFDFTIPRGDTGAAGTAATVAVGTTTTGAAGSSASVTNSGSSSAATFNFTIPRGDTGATGATGATGINWLGAWSSSTTYAVRDAVSYLGSSYYAVAANTNQPPAVGAYWNLLALKGTDGAGSGTVTSVALTAPSFLSVSGSPVTTAGTLALNYSGTALPVANGGTGATTLTGYVKGTGTSAMTASSTIPNTDISGLGTMSTQNANAVAITGGTINNASIGVTTQAAGYFTTLSANGTTSTTPALSFNASNCIASLGANTAGTYNQLVIQNQSGAAGSSTNYVISNNIGTDSSNYGEFGMNASTYTSTTYTDFFSMNNGVYFSSRDADVTVGSSNGSKTYLAWGTSGQSAHVINVSGAIGLSTNLGTTSGTTGTTGYGTSGQVLTSSGSSAAPTWTTPTAGVTTGKSIAMAMIFGF